MTDEIEKRIDFSALDPAGEPARKDRVVSAVMGRISAVPRRRDGGVWASIVGYLRPALAAAAMVAFVSGAALIYAQRAERAASAVVDAHQSAWLTPRMAEWAAGGAPPSAGYLVVLARGYR